MSTWILHTYVLEASSGVFCILSSSELWHTTLVKIEHHPNFTGHQPFLLDSRNEFKAILDEASRHCAPHRIVGLHLQQSGNLTNSMQWFTSGTITEGSVWKMLLAAAPQRSGVRGR